MRIFQKGFQYSEPPPSLSVVEHVLRIPDYHNILRRQVRSGELRAGRAPIQLAPHANLRIHGGGKLLRVRGDEIHAALSVHTLGGGEVEIGERDSPRHLV